MGEPKDFDWFLERLDVAKKLGDRDVMTNCPVHGGSDSLHVTEKNGKALVRCMAQQCPYADIVSALEDGGEATESDEVPEDADTPVPTVTRRSRGSKGPTPMSEFRGEDPETAPLDWLADYTGIPREMIATLGVKEHQGWIAHTWKTVPTMKLRKPGTADRLWLPKGGVQPRMWPQLPDSLPDEIWLAEGETDVIVLRLGYGLEAYTAGSASQPLSATEMKGLKARGVSRVVVAYDSDKDGIKASKETVANALEAGLSAVVASLGDPLIGAYKDWRERWLLGDKSPIPTSALEARQDVWRLDEVEAAQADGLLLDRLHPTDHSILFGDGGTGKGVIAAWWVARLTSELKMKVLVVDYEAHARHEWRPRVERFGGDLEAVHIWQPSEAIWDIAGEIAAIVKELDVDYVVVDSVTYACAGLEVEKSSTAAKYSLAIAQIGRPVLSIAHITKVDELKYPFGSIFWHNGARITISVQSKAYNAPRVLVNRKTNQAAPFKPVEIDWGWVDESLPETLTETLSKAPAGSGTIKERLARWISESTQPFSLGDAVNYLQNDGGQAPKTPQVVSNELATLAKEGQCHYDGQTWRPGAAIKRTKRSTP